MSDKRILIACVGNIFFGDDGFGVETAARLALRDLPPEVQVVDFGIRSYDLSYALLDGFETVILVDATPRGGAPGSLYAIEPTCAEETAPESLDAHAMDLVKVLRFARSLGGSLPRILLVGCEPAPMTGDDMQMGLSAPVEMAVEDAVQLIESLVAQLLAGQEVSIVTQR